MEAMAVAMVHMVSDAILSSVQVIMLAVFLSEVAAYTSKSGRAPLGIFDISLHASTAQICPTQNIGNSSSIPDPNVSNQNFIEDIMMGKLAINFDAGDPSKRQRY